VIKLIKIRDQKNTSSPQSKFDGRRARDLIHYIGGTGICVCNKEEIQGNFGA